VSRITTSKIMNEQQLSPIQRLNNIKKRITDACNSFQIDTDFVQLIGVSKTKPANLIEELHSLGLHEFGENYLNESIPKQEQLKHLNITWHYIGQIQSNKTRIIANNFQWVHGVDRLKIAQRLNVQNEQQQKLNILIQINLDNEESKAGVNLESAQELCREVSLLSNVQLRGFMAIPKPRDSFEQQQECLSQLKTLLTETNNTLGLNLDTISAGMSNDLEAAIAAGSNMVRIGTDLFGKRS